MRIAGVDKLNTEKNEKREERLLKLSIPSTSSQKIDSNSCRGEPESEISSSEEDFTKDEDFKWSYSLEEPQEKNSLTKTSNQLRVALPNVAQIADMTGASNRTVAKIATATLEDFGLVTSDNLINVVDKNKVRRELQKRRKHLQENATKQRKDIEAIYFDGRKDQTMKLVEGRRNIEQEEHVALLEEPGSKYFGHLLINPPANAANIAKHSEKYFILYEGKF
uniref:Uncharacterized protein LOC114349177 n=1 Tax=Diabrotica virgifera virgifera TaxID=50390 RepID=A0A6P7HIA6_DIAVI